MRVNHLRTFAVLLAILVGLAILQAVYYYPRLPDTVASHFGLWGNPDGWMSKQSFCMFGPIIVLIVTAPLGFGGIGLVSAAIWVSKAPSGGKSSDDLNADQRAQAEQKRETQELLADATGSFFLWFAFLTGAFLLAIMQLAFAANLRTPPILKHMIPMLIGYLVALGLVGIWKGRQITTLFPPRELPPSIWFPAKRFGWGWGLPACWQGWVVMLVWLSVLLFGMVKLLQHNLISFLIFLMVMIALMLLLCWWKGEEPRWRWGD
jgi:uncharacterized membrane protein